MSGTAYAALPSEESDMDAVLQYLKTQYPDVEIPDSADVIWVSSTGKGEEADIAEAMKRGAIATRASIQNTATAQNTTTADAMPRNIEAVTKYPQAPDPFQAAGDSGDGYDDEELFLDDSDVFDETSEEIRDAQMARHWLGIREDLSLREIDRKALDLTQEFAEAKYASTPVSLQGQNGALSYAYGDHIPRIVCRPNHLTDIALQAGEKVTAVHAGDTARWQIAPATSGAEGQETVHVVIKPLMPDIRTNLLVMTDRRTYNLDLLSSASEFIPAVRFSYPGDAIGDWNAFIAANKKQKEETVDAYNLSPDDLYFGYEITKGKDLSWRPVRVFDDGIKTYVEMPAKYKSLEAPVLMFYEGSQLKLVNYRVKDRFYVADRIMTKKAVLMAGKSRVVIERRKESSKRPLVA
ncbi:MAG: P-type conjugative transfer protein TrbG, partial [Synergistaceae bacterium]|nr:P-type conjugative transfer protein TrbG [Synergistaceae bacterium]